MKNERKQLLDWVRWTRNFWVRRRVYVLSGYLDYELCGLKVDIIYFAEVCEEKLNYTWEGNL